MSRLETRSSSIKPAMRPMQVMPMPEHPHAPTGAFAEEPADAGTASGACSNVPDTGRPRSNILSISARTVPQAQTQQTSECWRGCASGPPAAALTSALWDRAMGKTGRRHWSSPEGLASGATSSLCQLDCRLAGAPVAQVRSGQRLVSFTCVYAGDALAVDGLSSAQRLQRAALGFL